MSLGSRTKGFQTDSCRAWGFGGFVSQPRPGSARARRGEKEPSECEDETARLRRGRSRRISCSGRCASSEPARSHDDRDQESGAGAQPETVARSLGTRKNAGRSGCAHPGGRRRRGHTVADVGCATRKEAPRRITPQRKGRAGAQTDSEVGGLRPERPLDSGGKWETKWGDRTMEAICSSAR